MADGVVVTGLGVVGPFGAGREAARAAAAASAPPTAGVEAPDGLRAPGASRRYVPVPPVDLSRWVPPAAARRMGSPSRFAAAAARMAMEDAGLAGGDGAETAVVLGTAFGAVAFTERLLRQVFLEGPEAAQPFLFSECVANAAAGQAAIALGARGANVTATAREASPLVAVARAASEVREGRSARAVAGAVDEMTPLLHAILDRFGGTARPDAAGREIARPFDARRNGFLAGEGATVVTLEREGGAASRGVTPLARIRAAGGAFDPTASASDWGEGHASLGASLAGVLRRAGLEPADVDVVVSGASGSRRGDRLEGRTLLAAWGGAPLPPVVAPKGVCGEYGGGILAAGVLAVSGTPFGPTAGFAEPDEDIGVIPFDGRDRGVWRTALLTGLAAGGAAAWLLLERP